MSRPMQGGLTVAVLVLIPLLAVAGSDDLRATLDFTTGVLSLVSLTAAVGWGLLATDRLFLSSRQRLLAQGVHRTAAAASLGFLLLHVTVKVALGHVALIGALIPFGLGVRGTAGLIGFGSLAGLLMVVAAATGALRSAFAAPSRIAGRWRALHALSYPAWCAALVHGLYAGRPPAAWVVVLYSLCLLAVAGVLCLRLLPPVAKRRITGLITALIRPDVSSAEPEPTARAASPPDAEGVLPLGFGTGREASGHDVFDEGLRATPLPSSFERPRTALSAPAPPLYEAPPRGSDRLRTDPATDTDMGTFAAGSGASTAPWGPGPGIAAAYRAVSLAAGSSVPAPGQSSQQAAGRWPTPSPAPPAQALRPLPDPPTTPAPVQQSHPSYEPTPPPGPLYPPPAGEPWHAPAGDRP
ncbi:hypothetical protein [Streptomyces sp. NBC_01217]|uniref:hypothetical protein n=1 Tax=Streptomyces sp. NBC_01217 TaxID=2903779 RepID=UPI002E15974C|nr:hypothetical protein OG507_13165 [Streptomyces sp. NBC_01217]